MSYNHREAYCLMTYQCQRCERTEQIWNSRDGVTPFITTCYIEGCRGESQHINWHEDIQIPEYKLVSGQRFWRDGTYEEAREIIRRRVMSNPQYIPAGITPEDYVDRITNSSGAGEFSTGWPKLDMIPLEISRP